MDAELAIGERRAHFRVEAAEIFQVAIEMIGEPGAAHLAATLGGIHRDIRLAQQFGRILVTARTRAGKTDAGTDGQPTFVQLHRALERVDELAGYAFQDRACQRADHGYRELVPAQPEAARFVATASSQDDGAFLDQAVADAVAMLVVDQLETIEIDQRDGNLVLVAGLCLDEFVKRPAVREAREAVRHAQAFELADIAEPKHRERQGKGEIAGRADHKPAALRGLGLRDARREGEQEHACHDG